jgi:hypothetical protein
MPWWHQWVYMDELQTHLRKESGEDEDEGDDGDIGDFIPIQRLEIDEEETDTPE